MNSFSRSLRRIYQNFPVIKQLRAIQAQLAGLQQHLRLAESANLIEVIETLRAGSERYRDPKRLLPHGAQYWSQNYEDGMIAEIFRRIGVQSKTFLEIGIGDGRENNTAALVAMGWSGWWIDASKKACNLIAAQLREVPAVLPD